MRLSVKFLSITTLLLMGAGSFALAQSSNAPTFFGAGSQPAAVPTKSASPKPSPSQVWSKDQFSKQVQTLKQNNQTQYEQDLNARLKPTPAKAPSPAYAAQPTPANSSPTQNSDTMQNNTAPASKTAPQGASGAQGYTGFSAPATQSGSGTQKQSGWGVTY